MPLTHTRQKVSAFLNDLKLLKELDFGYQHSKDALIAIQDIFELHLTYLNKPKIDQYDPESIHRICATALSSLFNYLPLVGFIVRSTEPRNAFEVHDPLLTIAKQLLGKETKLVLSSEWNYSPYTYHGVPSLENFVFIGLPAPESSNPLLVPLSGHELGHSIWPKTELMTEYSVKIDEHVTTIIQNHWDECYIFFPTVSKDDIDILNMTHRHTWEQAAAWALRQSIETFCDFVGVRLFGEAYLHSFAYLLAPSQEGSRPSTYPNLRVRAENLTKAANSYKFNVPEGFIEKFDKEVYSGKEAREVFLLSVADKVLTYVVDELIDDAKQLVSGDGLSFDNKEIKRIEETIEHCIVPASNTKSLAVIINAAWNLFNRDDLWKNTNLDEPVQALHEVILKNIEVMQVELELAR